MSVAGVRLGKGGFKNAKQQQVIRLKYEPLAKQSEFHDSQAKYRAYVGGMGAGKTMAGAAEAIQLCMEYPGIMGLVGRATYPELRDSTWKEILNFPIMVDKEEVRLVDSPLIKRHDKSKMELEFANGSLMIGRPLEDAFDKIAKNLNLGFFWGDELTEIAEEMWLGIIRGRLRQVLPCPVCRQLPEDRKTICQRCNIRTVRHTAFGTSNPEGHDWVWKHFVATGDKDHFLVQASSNENTFLSQEYLDGLDQMPEDWKKRYKEGSFDTFSGLIYPEYQDRAPYVVSDFEIPEDWYRFVGIDHGIANPTAILWGAISPKGRIYIYDEFYEAGRRVDELAAIIKAKSGKTRIQDYIIDPATKQDKGNQSGLTIFSELEDNGIYCTPGKNQVMAGIDRVKEYLKIQDDKKPNLILFPQCRNLRMEFQTYRWKDLKIGEQRNKQEKPRKKDDHALDALRYLCAYAYDTPTLQPAKKKEFNYKDLLGNMVKPEEHWMAV